jgi:hypothetical protein
MLSLARRRELAAFFEHVRDNDMTAKFERYVTVVADAIERVVSLVPKIEDSDEIMVRICPVHGTELYERDDGENGQYWCRTAGHADLFGRVEREHEVPCWLVYHVDTGRCVWVSHERSGGLLFEPDEIVEYLAAVEAYNEEANRKRVRLEIEARTMTCSVCRQTFDWMALEKRRKGKKLIGHQVCSGPCLLAKLEEEDVNA